MCAHHTQTCDMPVWNAVGRLFLHFGKHITDDLGRIVRRLWRTGDLLSYQHMFPQTAMQCTRPDWDIEGDVEA